MTPGTLMERLRLGVTPVIKMRRDAEVFQLPEEKGQSKNNEADLKEVEMNLIKDMDRSNHA